ncbi:MAG TPA: sigma 54-interacting transcriptional regulator [Firmicutes bacterium]|nr:sigma 54-interacting transcriptional regulator [Bacillota bacterium]
MQHRETAVIRHSHGLHARVAALVVQKATELACGRGVELELGTADGRRVPATSMLAVLGLNLRQGEALSVVARGPGAQAAAEELARFLEQDFSAGVETPLSQVDDLLDETTLTAGQVFTSMAVGLVVTDAQNRVVVFNPAAERLFRLPATTALGRPVTEFWPAAMVEAVRAGGQPLTQQQVLAGGAVVATCTPIQLEGASRGTVTLLEDISHVEELAGELRAVKELKERLQLILDTVHDGISEGDKEGKITYVNPAYVEIVGQRREELLGRSVFALSPQGARARALKSGEKVLGALTRKPNGRTLVANVSPIYVEGEICGAVSVVKDVSEVEQLADKLHQMLARAEYLEEELTRTRELAAAFQGIIGRSGALREALAVAQKAAASTSTVLIRGESGTGKELVARALHAAGPRADKPFVRVNCAAIPAPLLESELFGHEKGAFTGAAQRHHGRFELADGGSIFLDEIGDMEPAMQAKLLRVLQEREFERVGGETTIRVDVRIIAATNRNLEEMVAKGLFREDLYWRLNVIPIFLPPLRERREDIPRLAEYFIAKLAARLGKKVTGISAEALACLEQYNWPGNVRELENVIERALNLTEGRSITADDLPAYVRQDGAAVDVVPASPAAPLLPFAAYEKAILARALAQCGSYRAAARALGLDHKTVAARARKYHLVEPAAARPTACRGLR